MHPTNIFSGGKKLSEATKALVMLHGRGGSALDILALARVLNVNDFSLAAPQAKNNTWYPLSFMAPVAENEPWLSSALEKVEECVNRIKTAGVASENIYFAGFSQGACLTLEYVTQNAQRFGGVSAFTGGLIGERVEEGKYSGNFYGTPVFISTGNPDPHVPVERVKESVKILERLDANVLLKIYDGRSHTISKNEIEIANHFIFK